MGSSFYPYFILFFAIGVNGARGRWHCCAPGPSIYPSKSIPSASSSIPVIVAPINAAVVAACQERMVILFISQWFVNLSRYCYDVGYG